MIPLVPGDNPMPRNQLPARRIGKSTWVQVSPPSVVRSSSRCRRWPSPPAAHGYIVDTEHEALVVAGYLELPPGLPAVAGAQHHLFDAVAQPFCASAKSTPNSVVSTGLCCIDHVLPPSAVVKMTPNSPTTQPLLRRRKGDSYSSTSPGWTISANVLRAAGSCSAARPCSTSCRRLRCGSSCRSRRPRCRSARSETPR